MDQNTVLSGKTMWNNKKKFCTVVGGKARIIIYAINILAALFLTIYSRTTGFEGFVFNEELRNMIFSIIGMILIREILFLFFSSGKKGKTSARRAYIISIFSWVLGGGVSVGVHYYFYGNDFLTYNVFKVFLGYCIVGGGFVARLEYGVYERKLNMLHIKDTSERMFLESFARRFLESTLLFILIPIATVMLVVIHYDLFNNGVIPIAVIKELVYMGIAFLVVGLGISLLFGFSFIKDVKKIIKGLTALKEGDLDVRVDSTRLDEFGEISACIGEVAQKFNGIKQQIQAAFQRLEKGRG